MVYETVSSIHEWATTTFGTPEPDAVILRMAAEADELIEATDSLVFEDNPEAIENALDEAADVFIVACHADPNMWLRVNKKMMINRKRQWKINADGTGQHLEMPNVKVE